jgi:hypothetical protein
MPQTLHADRHTHYPTKRPDSPNAWIATGTGPGPPAQAGYQAIDGRLMCPLTGTFHTRGGSPISHGVRTTRAVLESVPHTGRCELPNYGELGISLLPRLSCLQLSS